MKRLKQLLIAFVIIVFMPVFAFASSVNNVTSEGVDGNLVFYDSSKNEIFTIDATNRKLSIPSGSLFQSAATNISLRGVTYILPAADGAASQFIQTDGSGTLSWATGGATAYDDIADPDADSSITFADNEILEMTFADVNEDMFTIQGLGAFGDVSVVKIEQKTGLATDGTVLEVVSADTDVDPLVVTANSANRIQVYGSGNVDIVGLTGVINYTDFDVSADGAVTLANDDGGTMITLTPSAAAIGIDASNATITTAITVGANSILGTTGIIDYTSFDVDASGNIVSLGNVTAVNGTFSGNVNITGTFQQDSITAVTAATTLTVDGTGTGGVTVGGTSTGTVTLGGGATLVNLPSTVDMTLSGGDFAVTDTANADMVTFTNNTMIAADLVTLSATGTRTSDNVIEIADGATTATTIGITANAQTTGNGISYTNTGALLTGAGLYMAITDGAGFTGDYLNLTDAGTSDFRVAKYGKTTIAGAASADMFVITAGDLQMTAGDIDMDKGFITIDNDADEANYIKRNFNGAGTGAVLTVEDTDTDTTNSTLNIVSAGTAGTGLKIDATGTGNAIGIDLNVAGDLPAIDIDASAARTGDVIDILMTNQLAERALNVTGAFTSANGEGVIDMKSTGQIAAGGSFIRLDNDTAQAADASSGYMLNIDDDTLVATTPKVYAVSINSASNEALSVGAGESLFADTVTMTAMSVHNGGIDVNEDVDIDLDATDEEVVISTSAEVSGAGAAVTTIESTDADVSVQGYLLKLQYADDSQANADYFACVDDSGATPDTVFTIAEDGNTTTAGTLTVGSRISNTPMTFAFTTEGDITATLTSSVILLDGDDDGENDTIDLQNGTTAGQIAIFIAAVEIDANDTCTIAVTDTTCTNCPAVVFDAVGESATYVWTGATWAVTSLRQ